MYLIVKLDAPGMGKQEVVDNVKDAVARTANHFRVGDPRRDIEVISVVAATPKRLARVGEAMREGK